MPANSLDNYVRSRAGGNTGRVENFGNSFEQIRQFDPGARIVDEETGGEGGGNVRSFIYYDESKLPEYKGNWITDRSAGAADSDRSNLRDLSRIWHDDAYGDMTTNDNVKPEKDPWWVKVAPLLVSLAAPALGGAFLSATGVGLGAAGTAAATAGAAGGATGALAAGSAAGGATMATQVPKWMGQLLSKAPQLARQIDNGGFSLESIIPLIAQLAGKEMGVPGGYVSAGTSLANLARRKP